MIGSRVTWEIGYWTCLWRIILIMYLSLEVPTNMGAPYSDWDPELCKMYCKWSRGGGRECSIYSLIHWSLFLTMDKMWPYDRQFFQLWEFFIKLLLLEYFIKATGNKTNKTPFSIPHRCLTQYKYNVSHISNSKFYEKYIKWS